MSVEEVRERAVEARTARKLHAVTAVLGLVVESAADEALAASQGIENEIVVERRWKFLGFDVVDGRTSGLSNCGYNAEAADALCDAWAARLNDHGLFDDVHDALAFRTMTDARVPEHATFAVFALWMIE